MTNPSEDAVERVAKVIENMVADDYTSYRIARAAIAAYEQTRAPAAPIIERVTRPPIVIEDDTAPAAPAGDGALKACPWCNGAARKHGSSDGMWGCFDNPECLVKPYATTMEAWNRRAPSDAESRLKALAKEVERFLRFDDGDEDEYEILTDAIAVARKAGT